MASQSSFDGTVWAIHADVPVRNRSDLYHATATSFATEPPAAGVITFRLILEVKLISSKDSSSDVLRLEIAFG